MESQAPEKKKRWKRRDIVRKAWAVLCLFIMVSMLVSMGVNGY